MVSLCDHLALRPPTLCGCDCKIITTAICFGLHRYSIRCIHPAQRCISSSQMTDHIFEVETTALAHVACATRDSGILVTDFAAAYPSVNHSWIFHVLEKAEVPGFSCRFLRVIYCNGMMEVEFARKTRGQFLMSRGVRQGCPASRFLFAMAFRPYLSMAPRLYHPKNPAASDFLQPSPCACADDFAVVASSFLTLMTALSPAFEVVYRVAGLNLNQVLFGTIWQRQLS